MAEKWSQKSITLSDGSVWVLMIDVNGPDWWYDSTASGDDDDTEVMTEWTLPWRVMAQGRGETSELTIDDLKQIARAQYDALELALNEDAISSPLPVEVIQSSGLSSLDLMQSGGFALPVESRPDEQQASVLEACVAAARKMYEETADERSPHERWRKVIGAALVALPEEPSESRTAEYAHVWANTDVGEVSCLYCHTIADTPDTPRECAEHPERPSAESRTAEPPSPWTPDKVLRHDATAEQRNQRTDWYASAHPSYPLELCSYLANVELMGVRSALSLRDARIGELCKALRDLHSAVDSMMGDSEIDNDDSPLMIAMQEAARLGYYTGWDGTVRPSDLSQKLEGLVVQVSLALRAKLGAAQAKYGHKDEWAEEDRVDAMREAMMEHIAKGDPLDVIAYAAFLWHHDASTAPTESPVSERMPLWLHGESLHLLTVKADALGVNGLELCMTIRAAKDVVSTINNIRSGLAIQDAKITDLERDLRAALKEWGETIEIAHVRGAHIEVRDAALREIVKLHGPFRPTTGQRVRQTGECQACFTGVECPTLRALTDHGLKIEDYQNG